MHRVFSVQGPYPVIRSALKARGWVEQRIHRPKHHRRRHSDEGRASSNDAGDSDDDDNDDDDGELDANVTFKYYFNIIAVCHDLLTLLLLLRNLRQC